MAVDRAMLRQALNDLVRLKGRTENPTRFLALLYNCAVSEWASKLGMDRHKLNKLIHIREVGSARPLH
jgi:hypothetical protein